MTIPVLPLQYEIPREMMGAEARPVFASMLWLSVLSGLAVGVCFLSLTGEFYAVALHALVFAALLFVAVRTGVLIARLQPHADESNRRFRIGLDLAAGIGLVMIGLAPAVYQIADATDPPDTLMGLLIGGLGLAYGLLATSTIRHLMLYRYLAVICRQANCPGMARNLVVLGWFKTLYEGVWLGCCTIALLCIAGNHFFDEMAEELAIFCAVGGFFGAIGFGGVWIWMIISHAQLVRLAR